MCLDEKHENGTRDKKNVGSWIKMENGSRKRERVEFFLEQVFLVTIIIVVVITVINYSCKSCTGVYIYCVHYVNFFWRKSVMNEYKKKNEMKRSIFFSGKMILLTDKKKGF